MGKREAEAFKTRLIAAQKMPATQLINTYRDSLIVEQNPLSIIYENEILRRLWLADTLIHTPKS